MILVSITIKIWERKKNIGNKRFMHAKIEYFDEKGTILNKTKKSDVETIFRWLNLHVSGDEEIYFKKHIDENDIFCIFDYFTCKTKKGFDSTEKWEQEYKMVPLI